MSERTQMLKSRVHVKSVTFRRFKTTPGFKSEVVAELEFRPGTKLCLERARLITESFKTTCEEPIATRHAKALDHLIQKMTVYIQEGELIVGNFASDPFSLPLHPELGQHWLGEAIDDGLRNMLTEEQKTELRSILDYWKDISIAGRIQAVLPEELKPCITYNGMFFSNSGRACRSLETPNFEDLLSVGLNGIIGKVETQLKELASAAYEMDTNNYLERKQNLDAMVRCLKAGIKLGKRYAECARKLAKLEKEVKRREELNSIAEICEWVPGNRPRTLWEAIQSCFFINLICTQLEFHGQGFGNRMDVLLNPFYQKDKAEGRITKEQGQELMECLLIKLSERGHLVHPNVVSGASGNSDWSDITICGVTPEGEDATNEFSFIILDAAKSVKVSVPTIALRYHPKISEQVISKAIDVLRTGIGYPAFFNDSAAIPWLLGRGVALKKAREYVIPSCVNAQIPGMTSRTAYPHLGNVNLSKCLELALFEGKDKDIYTGKQLGAKTPDPKSFKSIEDLIHAYLVQVNFVADKISKIDKFSQAVIKQYARRPFASALLDGCIKDGTDCAIRKDDIAATILATGLTNVADSLTVIKKFVFDQKIITMAELIEALRTNFDRKEELRQRLINQCPKFGNDDDYADDFARQVHIRTNEEFMKFKDYYGWPLMLNGSMAGAYYGFSKACGATPDGRKDGEPLADGVISPTAGMDRLGPTAVLKSVSKVTPTYNHLLNQKFLPQFLEGQNKKAFAQYLKTWADLGIYHIQFNVVDRATLLDAQVHPEKYPDLIVRVAGYSAYFADLAKEQQNDIIRRTEQCFV
jgi:pyruvate formate-lyase/glycerol dehydratase family glycyl radical enzyme